MYLKPLSGILATLALACSLSAATPAAVSSRPFGRTKAGESAALYTLTNANGLSADITNYGGIVVRLLVPDRTGKLDDVVLGYNTLDEYLAATPYFGAIVGRVGNRIAGGRFSLDGKTYTLATNNFPSRMPCTLHGGRVGFDKVVWQAEAVVEVDGPCLKLHYLSKDGEEGFPGNLDVIVCYRLTNRNELKIDYRATTDKPTPVNLTQHNYYNLRGDGNGDILGHLLTLNASRMTPMNAGLVPTGEIVPVAGTRYDFTRPVAVGANAAAANAQGRPAAGYDDNWMLDRKTARDLELAATVYEPTTGRVMEVWTQEPAMQFYSGTSLGASIVGKTGKGYRPFAGFCLEAQHVPDSPNQPAFPSVILRPGEVYQTTTVYRFSTR